MSSRSVRFAEVGLVLAGESRRSGGIAPSFRSPPRTVGSDRALRRRVDGSVSVAVRLSGRPFVAVVADMIEGTIAANRFEGAAAEDLRRRCWSAIDATQGQVLSAA